MAEPTAARRKAAAFWADQLDQMAERERRRARKLPGWRTRKHRRALAGVVLLGSAVLVAAAATFRIDRPFLFSGLWIAGMVIWVVGWNLLRILTGTMTNAFSALLDERERQWRHRVTFLAFQVLAFLMLIAMSYLLVIADTADAGWRGVTMLGALLILGTSMPPVFLGWTLPDDDPDDFLDEPNDVNELNDEYIRTEGGSGA